jgi:hypothetical protein
MLIMILMFNMILFVLQEFIGESNDFFRNLQEKHKSIMKHEFELVNSMLQERIANLEKKQLSLYRFFLFCFLLTAFVAILRRDKSISAYIKEVFLSAFRKISNNFRG